MYFDEEARGKPRLRFGYVRVSNHTKSTIPTPLHLRIELKMRRHINVLIGEGVTSEDKRLFFADFDSKYPDNDEWFHFKEMNDYPQLLREISLFSSASEARRNGWDKPVEKGFTFPVKIGKFKHELTILKII